MMETTIRTFDGIPYTMRLTRDAENHTYRLGFYSQSRFSRTEQEVHIFTDFDTAWEHFSNNCHYYNNVRPEPITEEQFNGLPATYLYGGTYAKNRTQINR